MVNAPAFLRRGNSGQDDKAPLLPQSSPSPSPPPRSPSSAFAAPAQQALGPFPDAGSAAQSSAYSFSLGRGASTGNLGTAAGQQPCRNGQERSTNSSMLDARSSSFTFGGPQQGGVQNFASASSMPYIPGYNCPVGRVVSFTRQPPPVASMPPPQRPIYAVGVSAGPPQPQDKWSKPYPKLIKWLNVLSFLVLFVNTPMGVFFSYYLWASTAVLCAGPIAAGLSMAAVFLTQWGCCGSVRNSIKRMKLLVTMAAIFDVGGAIVVPLVQFGVECPDGEVENCSFDKPIGEGFSIGAGVFMFLHAVLCVMTRFQAKDIVVNYFMKDSVDKDFEGGPSFTAAPMYYPYPCYGSFPSALPPMGGSFTMSQASINAHKKPGVVRPVRYG